MYRWGIFLFTAVMLVSFVFPAQAQAQFNFFKGPLVPCGNDVKTGPWQDEFGGEYMCIVGECTTCGLVTLASNLINFAIFLGVILAALLFAYAGGLYLFSAANPGNISKAHKIFWDVLLGLVIILVAWMVIDTVMKVLYGNGPQGWGPWNTILCGDTQAVNDCRPVEKSRAGLIGTGGGNPPPPNDPPGGP